MSEPIMWSDRYTEEELEVALDHHAAQLAHKHGYYEIADELRAGAACIRDLCEIRDRLLNQIASMAGAGMEVSGGIERVRQSLRASIESLSKAPPL